jgi:hypothetical protein
MPLPGFPEYRDAGSPAANRDPNVVVVNLQPTLLRAILILSIW